MIFESARWVDVAPDFDRLGRENYAECNISHGHYPYSLDHKTLYALDELGMVHITTAREGKKLVGYVLSLLLPRHLQYDCFCSQSIGLYLSKDCRKGKNGLNLMAADEKFLWDKGVKAQYAGFTLDKDLEPLFVKRGWTEAEKMFVKYKEV